MAQVQKQKLPAKTEDHIVDVSLTHLLIGFAVVFGGVFVIGSSLIIIRDLSKYKRQKAILNGSLILVETLLNKEKKNAKD